MAVLESLCISKYILKEATWPILSYSKKTPQAQRFSPFSQVLKCARYTANLPKPAEIRKRILFSKRCKLHFSCQDVHDWKTCLYGAEMNTHQNTALWIGTNHDWGSSTCCWNSNKNKLFNEHTEVVCLWFECKNIDNQAQARNNVVQEAWSTR